ncbi:MAG: hypothetical protein R2912_02495 [Eubacteriales bacterium]
MAEQDITAPWRAAMLATSILPQESVDEILAGLEGILNDLKCGIIHIDPRAEDIHSFVEFELTTIGENGKSDRNDRSRSILVSQKRPPQSFR